MEHLNIYCSVDSVKIYRPDCPTQKSCHLFSCLRSAPKRETQELISEFIYFGVFLADLTHESFLANYWLEMNALLKDKVTVWHDFLRTELNASENKSNTSGSGFWCEYIILNIFFLLTLQRFFTATVDSVSVEYIL